MAKIEISKFIIFEHIIVIIILLGFKKMKHLAVQPGAERKVIRLAISYDLLINDLKLLLLASNFSIIDFQLLTLNFQRFEKTYFEYHRGESASRVNDCNA